ncbi:hypothetical protein HanXRQr2_Chr16g0748661 [Helianthus annuus]|uniref:Uncharacterized protein n=1 Tax=Helianthus annuus TaxID=4232 RepID=A0A9K3DTH6_HELAN|nr:hypothetical protein HanXRQr2_Chr16g0748661 [Helianthus annuus]KAJ0438157.1 hypothetical protein HanHA300_Chr16g0610711 [Helianthus annuus]KAJ0460477.1 hypothetical protein HanHA89_Chr16g0661271 [Helianthus annuus]
MVDLASAKELLPLGSEDIKIYLIGVFGVKTWWLWLVVKMTAAGSGTGSGRRVMVNINWGN